MRRGEQKQRNIGKLGTFNGEDRAQYCLCRHEPHTNLCRCHSAFREYNRAALAFRQSSLVQVRVLQDRSRPVNVKLMELDEALWYSECLSTL